MRESLLAGNESNLTRLDFRDSPTNLGNLSGCDVRWNLVRKTLHEAVGEFSALRSRELLRLFEDVGNGLSHGIRIQAARTPASAQKRNDKSAATAWRLWWSGEKAGEKRRAPSGNE